MKTDDEFILKRDSDTIHEFAKKINALIKIYADIEGLNPYLKVVHQRVITDAMLNGQKIGVQNDSIPTNRIEVVQYCSNSADIRMREFCEILRSFVSDTELEDQLAARYLPDYLTIKNIFHILLYEVPRKIRKSDLEHLNRLYKKYNVKF